MAAVIFFIFQADLASVLDTWLIGIVAWIAAWGGIMLVHYYKFASAATSTPTVLFEPVGTKRLPDVNWATMVVLRGRHLLHLAVPLRADAGPAGLRRPCHGRPRPVLAGRRPVGCRHLRASSAAGCTAGTPRPTTAGGLAVPRRRVTLGSPPSSRPSSVAEQ